MPLSPSTACWPSRGGVAAPVLAALSAAVRCGVAPLTVDDHRCRRWRRRLMLGGRTSGGRWAQRVQVAAAAGLRRRVRVVPRQAVCAAAAAVCPQQPCSVSVRPVRLSSAVARGFGGAHPTGGAESGRHEREASGGGQSGGQVALLHIGSQPRHGGRSRTGGGRRSAVMQPVEGCRGHASRRIDCGIDVGGSRSSRARLTTVTPRSRAQLTRPKRWGTSRSARWPTPWQQARRRRRRCPPPASSQTDSAATDCSLATLATISPGCSWT